MIWPELGPEVLRQEKVDLCEELVYHHERMDGRMVTNVSAFGFRYKFTRGTVMVLLLQMSKSRQFLSSQS